MSNCLDGKPKVDVTARSHVNTLCLLFKLSRVTFLSRLQAIILICMKRPESSERVRDVYFWHFEGKTTRSYEYDVVLSNPVNIKVFFPIIDCQLLLLDRKVLKQWVKINHIGHGVYWIYHCRTYMYIWVWECNSGDFVG